MLLYSHREGDTNVQSVRDFREYDLLLDRVKKVSPSKKIFRLKF